MLKKYTYALMGCLSVILLACESGEPWVPNLDTVSALPEGQVSSSVVLSSSAVAVSSVAQSSVAVSSSGLSSSVLVLSSSSTVQSSSAVISSSALSSSAKLSSSSVSSSSVAQSSSVQSSSATSSSSVAQSSSSVVGGCTESWVQGKVYTGSYGGGTGSIIKGTDGNCYECVYAAWCPLSAYSPPPNPNGAWKAK